MGFFDHQSYSKEGSGFLGYIFNQKNASFHGLDFNMASHIDDFTCAWNLLHLGGAVVSFITLEHLHLLPKCLDNLDKPI